MGKFKKMSALRARLAQAAVATGALALAGAAQAQSTTTIDVSDVVSTITSGVATVTQLGIAVLSLVVVVKLFKWVKGAM